MIFGLVGPTGVGKSKLSLELAQALNFEILSVDAYQIYQGMDIGTAKVSKEDLKKVPHHLVDVVSFKETFDVKRYQEEARKIIDQKREKNIPILCVGGSGFYLKSVLHRFEFSDQRLDEVLPDLEEMVQFIKNIDPEALNTVHINNHKRIKNLYTRLKSGKKRPKDHQKPFYDYHLFGLTMSKESLKKQISLRVDEMIKEGLEKEVRALYHEGLSKTASEAIGYKEWDAYFNHTQTLEETIDLIKKHTMKYIKKQETYFKHQFNIEWFDLDKISYEEAKAFILKKIKHLKSL